MSGRTVIMSDSNSSLGHSAGFSDNATEKNQALTIVRCSANLPCQNNIFSVTLFNATPS